MATFYVTQNGAGTQDGTSLGNAWSAADFNTAGNWANPKVSGKIGTGDTVTLSGTLTTALTVQANGSAGSVIAIQFAEGASLSAPIWNASGALNLQNKSYIVVDGGTNGLIESTDAGTGLTYYQVNYGIQADSSSNVEIKNLHIHNLYVHTSVSDSRHEGFSSRGVHISGSNNSVHDCVFHDMYCGIVFDYNNGDTNVRFYNNDMTRTEHGFTISGAAGASTTDLFIYGNTVGDFSNWDITGGGYHHDAIHAWGTLSPRNNPTNWYIYNNYFYGPGVDMTGHIYLEGNGDVTPWTDTGIAYIFNNVLIGSNLQVYEGVGCVIVNNTIIGGDISAIASSFGSSGTGYVIKNNVIMGGTVSTITFDSSAVITNWGTDLDYNVYGDNGGYNAFSRAGYNTSDLSAWTSTTGGDQHSYADLASTLSINQTTGAIGASSPAIGRGTNLTALATGNLAALASDKDGVARPSSGVWDAGAYQYGSSAPIGTITLSVR